VNRDGSSSQGDYNGASLLSIDLESGEYDEIANF